MLRDNLHKGSQLVTYGFLVSIEAEGEVSPEHLRTKLADACRWVEGTGEIDVTLMGEITDEAETNTNS